MTKDMFERMKIARKEIEKFTADQIAFAVKTHDEILKCWSIDGTNDEEVAKAFRQMREVKDDMSEIAFEDGLFENWKDFDRLLELVEVLDLSGCAAC